MSSVNININLANIGELTHQINTVRNELVDGGFTPEEAYSITSQILNRALDTGNTTVSMGYMDDQRAFLESVKREVKEYTIEKVAQFMSGQQPAS